ncbi:MAG: hypothetical protein UZ13_03544 [Chloroflexi bacterium OLB13]|nr:MAG: hypothetical protein UZ13_03544 [Chloroflexi bacterium OLB13]
MKRLTLMLIAAILTAAFAPLAGAQDGFDLISPDGSILIRNLNTTPLTFVWEPLTGATAYDISVFKISTNIKDTPLGPVFTSSILAGACGATCSYTPTSPQQALIDNGQFAWTVEATTSGGTVEAANAPILFSVTRGATEFIVNGDFETGSLTPWVGVSLTGDSVRAGDGVGGSYGFRFKGSAAESAQIKQTIKVEYYAISVSDSLQFNAQFYAPKPNPTATFVVKVIYSDTSGLPTEKFTRTITQNSAFAAIAPLNIFPDGPVKKLKVQIKHFSVSGKVYVDDLSLVLDAVGPRMLLPAPLPVPLPLGQ